jgi:hypothetical protein
MEQMELRNFICRRKGEVCGQREYCLGAVAYPGILVRGGGVSTNSVEDIENGDLGAVAP